MFCSLGIYTSMKLLIASLAFWIKDSFPVLNIVYMFSDFTKYPNSIYSKGVQFLLSFIIPFAFTAFIPASFFLGKEDFAYGVLGTCIVAVVAFVIAYGTWIKGMKAYESSGN
jgi:ABC-2 type transport system permease protein